MEEPSNLSEGKNDQIIRILGGVKDVLCSVLSYAGRKFAWVVTNHFEKVNSVLCQKMDDYIRNNTGCRINRYWYDKNYSNLTELFDKQLAEIDRSKKELENAIHNISEALKNLKTLIENQKIGNNTKS